MNSQDSYQTVTGQPDGIDLMHCTRLNNILANIFSTSRSDISNGKLDILSGHVEINTEINTVNDDGKLYIIYLYLPYKIIHAFAS